MKAILRAEKVSKTFITPQKVDVLDQINLSLYSGQTIAIMGASGEGKSTLLQILGTLETPTTGKIFIEEQLITQKIAPKIRNTSIGFIFQNFHLLEDYTVLQNVLIPAWVGRETIKKDSIVYRKAEDLLRNMGLEDKKHFPTNVLSGGEKQRVAIARALCNNPKILLADEPSGNLDHKNSEKIHSLLFYCAKRLDKGVIVVTHDLKLARLCDFVYVLEKGKLS